MYLPTNGVFTVFSQNTAFFKNLVLKQNIHHLIRHKKGYINFLPKKPPFPKKKKMVNAPPEQFFAVFSENTAVYKKVI